MVSDEGNNDSIENLVPHRPLFCHWNQSIADVYISALRYAQNSSTIVHHTVHSGYLHIKLGPNSLETITAVIIMQGSHELAKEWRK